MIWFSIPSILFLWRTQANISWEMVPNCKPWEVLQMTYSLFFRVWVDSPCTWEDFSLFFNIMNKTCHFNSRYGYLCSHSSEYPILLFLIPTDTWMPTLVPGAVLTTGQMDSPCPLSYEIAEFLLFGMKNSIYWCHSQCNPFEKFILHISARKSLNSLKNLTCLFLSNSKNNISVSSHFLLLRNSDPR